MVRVNAPIKKKVSRRSSACRKRTRCNSGVRNKSKRCSVKHFATFCDECGAFPLTGVRYKCTTCVDFDCCSKCFGYLDHDSTHEFKKITCLLYAYSFPGNTPVKVIKCPFNRKTGRKLTRRMSLPSNMRRSSSKRYFKKLARQNSSPMQLRKRPSTSPTKLNRRTGNVKYYKKLVKQRSSLSGNRAASNRI